jgi:hypothetical protein
MTKNKNTPVTADQKFKRILNWGLAAAITFLIAGQLLVVVAAPMFPLYGMEIINVAIALNILAIPAVAFMVYGAVQRYFARF